MDRITHRIVEGVNEICRGKGIISYCNHIASVWWLQFGIDEPLIDYRDTFRVDKMKYQLFYKLCQQRGIHLHPVRGRFYTSAAHTDKDVDKTLEIVEEVFTIMTKEQ
jgi:glutamate-1-semialdehyde aminotransferase